MTAPLKQHHTVEHKSQKEDARPKFKEFQEFNSNNAKLRELLFFARIALFGISTVLISFFLLVLNLTPLWAFTLAMLASLAITSTISSIIWSLKQ